MRYPRPDSLLVIGAIVALLAIVGCSKKPEPEKTTGEGPAATEQPKPTTKTPRATLTLQAGDHHVSELGGYYAAMRDHYGEAQLRLVVRAHEPGKNVVDEVLSGRADLSVIDAEDLIRQRADGRDLVALMAPLQGTLDCVVMQKSVAPASLAKLEGVKLEIRNDDPLAHVLAKKTPMTNVEVVPPTSSSDRFKNDKGAFVLRRTAIKLTRRSDKLELSCVSPKTIGYDPYASVLFTSRATFDKKKDVLEKFVDASQKGWVAYGTRPVLVHMEMRNVINRVDNQMLGQGFRAISPLIDTKKPKEVGKMTPETWKGLVTTLEEAGVVAKGKVDPAKAYATF